MRDSLDRFYTHDDTVEQCLGLLDLHNYDVIVEPSAGAGAFSDRIEGCVAFDIMPAKEGIIQKDYLTVTPADLTTQDNVAPAEQKIAVVGNPPFGKRSVLAKQFIRHSIDLGASLIAFILPRTFEKRNNQNVFPQGWRLVEVERVADDFVMPDGTSLHIPCSFFVWVSPENNTTKPGVDLRQAEAPAVNEFTFLGRGATDADFSLNGNSGRVKELSAITNSKAEHYIKVNEGYDVEEIKAELSRVDFSFVSSVNGGVAWINRDDIRRAWVAHRTAN